MFEQQFIEQGYAIVPKVLSINECETLALNILPSEALSGGTRSLIQESWCESIALRLRDHSHLSRLVPKKYAAVQCTYFEKSSARNWLVPPHQDLSIPVAKRTDHSALKGWSEKEGALFVQAPAELLSQLFAVRLHLDPCSTEDGPLRVMPASHRYGRLNDARIRELRETHEEVACCVNTGDALVMCPLLLHASSKSFGKSRRRVLHFVYGPRDLPYGLEWQHAI
jgi:Phytanoyl-CoA dioxygenase (PhyH)